MEESLSETLGIQTSDVVVTREEDGTFRYTISSPTAEEGSAIQDQLQSAAISEKIATEVMEENPIVTNVEVAPEYGVYAEIELVVDATNTENIKEAITNFENDYSNEWAVETEDKYVEKLTK